LTGLGRGECISCTWVSFLRMDNIDLKWTSSFSTFSWW
jgi:hypothetical protein